MKQRATDFLIRVVSEKSILDILQVSDKRCLRCYVLKGSRNFKFSLKHLFKRVGLKLYKLIVIVVVFRNLLTQLLQNLPLSLRWREDTLRYFALLLRKVEVNTLLGLFNLHKIELVVSLLHKLFPVIVLVVVSARQEFSRQKLRVNRFRTYTNFTHWHLHRLAGALPIKIELTSGS